MATFKIASDEGANKYGHEVGETVELDITKDEALAVTAAGWLEHVNTKPAKEKE